MGADRYSVCPRCRHEHEASIAEEETRVGKLYGQVPLEEFDAAREALAQRQTEGVTSTLRENWEITEPETDGVMDFHYRADCGICGLSVKVEEHYPIWTKL